MTTTTETPTFDTLLHEFAEAEVNIQEIRERSPWQAPTFDTDAAWDRVLKKAKEKPAGSSVPKQRQKKQRGRS